MPTLYIADAERDVGMKNLSQKEAAKVLEGMKVKIEIPKAAVTQWKRNTALDMAIEALKYSEIPNSSDTISRQWLMECVNEGWIKFETEKDENKFIHLVRDTAPSAHPEIIRCKDCKHSKEWYKDKRRCFLWHEEGIGVFEYGYCNYAKRRLRGKQDE